MKKEIKKSTTDSSKRIEVKALNRMLSNRDRDILLNILENPPPPNNALIKLAAEYKKRVISK